MDAIKSILVNLWLVLVGNPAAMRFDDGSLLPGYCWAKDNTRKGVNLRRLYAFKVTFPSPAPGRLTKPGNIVEFFIHDEEKDTDVMVASGRARRLFTDNMTFICRDIKEIVSGGAKLLLERPIKVRISGREEGQVVVSDVDEIEHPINSPITAYIRSGQVTAFELKYLKPRDRWEAFFQIQMANKGTGKIVLHGDFKGKRLFVYIADPIVWAEVLGGKWGSVAWLYEQKNLCKVLKLMLTPTKATFSADGDARVYIGAVSGKDGPIFFRPIIKHKRLENGNCQMRSLPNVCGIGCKGLGIADKTQWAQECAHYGIDPNAYDIICNEDAIKINSRGVKPGDTVLIPWSAWRVINLNLRRGSGHIGRQIVMMPPEDAQDVLFELGLMERAEEYVQLTKWNWRAWLRACSSMNDSKMEDNFFHSFLDLQPENEDWVLPQDQTSLTRGKARLEIAWRDNLVKLPFGTGSVQIGYDFRCDEAEKLYLEQHGEERHFAIFGPECKDEIEKFGSMAVATFPMVNDKGVLTVFPIYDDKGEVIYGPRGMALFSLLFNKKKNRDGDGDKAAKRGLNKILKSVYKINEYDEPEEAKMIVTTVEECNIKVLVQSQASWASAINVGIEDLTCSYIVMSLHRMGIEITPEEQSDFSRRREEEGLHLLKHATGAGKSIVTDPDAIQNELLARFGKGRVKKPSERQKLYYWVDRNDKKLASYPSAKKAIVAMDKSFNKDNPGEVDHFLVTTSANILASPSVRIMHRLCNLLPAMFSGVMTGEQLHTRIKGNPYGRAMALLYVNRIWEGLKGNKNHAEQIFKKKSDNWAWQKVLASMGLGLLAGKSYGWNIEHIELLAERLDEFYSDVTDAINVEFRNSQDWTNKVLRKHIQYGDLFRSIRFMFDGIHPGYEELYNCPPAIMKYLSATGIVYILPSMIAQMGEEEKTTFLTLLSMAVGVKGWGLSRKRNRKTGGIARLLPFEPCVLAEIEYAKYQMQLGLSQYKDKTTILASINPVIRKYIDAEYDDGSKFDILTLGQGFDARRKKQDIQISEGWKEDEIPGVSEDNEDEPELFEDEEVE